MSSLAFGIRPLVRALCSSTRLRTSMASFATAAAEPAVPTCVTKSTCVDEPSVFSFFEKATSTWQYVVSDPATSKAVIIDPVLDYEPNSATVATRTADSLLSFIDQHGFDVIRLLETHAHADHLSASQHLKRRLGGHIPVGIGKRIKEVQETFAPVYGIEPASLEGAFDTLWEDDEKFALGNLPCQVIHLPGHTPDHVGYLCGGSLFVGDTVFYVSSGLLFIDASLVKLSF
jgi:glyoxylase-like metal-dependent hydrolase (beta-lactamase superfamily II)